MANVFGVPICLKNVLIQQEHLNLENTLAESMLVEPQGKLGFPTTLDKRC